MVHPPCHVDETTEAPPMGGVLPTSLAGGVPAWREADETRRLRHARIMAKERVLVVDDEENLRLVLRTLLVKQGYEVEVASCGEEALSKLQGKAPAYILADVRMPGISGLELSAEIRRRAHAGEWSGLEPTVIVMSAYGSVELAIEAMKAGAYDYISKPFKQDEVLLVLRKAAEREALRLENRRLRAVVHREQHLGGFVAKSPAMARALEALEKAAPYDTTVLLHGESGTGKGLAARALHHASPRRDRPLITLSCGALPESLLESELFGHLRGAFTDALEDRQGVFEAAHGSTLFLDEIGELGSAVQAKLLRTLQEGTVRPLGDTRDRTIDVRVVGSTSRDLAADVEAGRFRQDLFYRLHVLPIELPPLRQRREDLPLLVEQVLGRVSLRLGRPVLEVDERAKKRLFEYGWPGNVRELENALEQAAVLCAGERIMLEDLPAAVRSVEVDVLALAERGAELSIKKMSRKLESTLIARALEATGGNRTAAAKLLEISHRALLYKIKDYGL